MYVFVTSQAHEEVARLREGLREAETSAKRSQVSYE